MRTLFVAPALAAGLFAMSGVAFAQPTPTLQPPEVLTKVYACVDVTDSVARLACFDAAVGQLKTAETQGQFSAVDVAGVRQIEREAFGFSLPSLPRLGLPRLGSGGGATPEVERTAELSTTISRVGRYDGRQSFVLANGQTWLLIDSEGNRLARPGAAVTIKRATMGGFLMSVEAGGAALRVRRAE